MSACEPINTTDTNLYEKALMYEKAFSILMEYWESLPDEEKPKIDARLKFIGV